MHGKMITAGIQYKTVSDWVAGPEVSGLTHPLLRELNKISRDDDVLISSVPLEVVRAWLCQPHFPLDMVE